MNISESEYNTLKDSYESLTVKTVISYFRSEGIRVNKSDFFDANAKELNAYVTSFFDSNTAHTSAVIYYKKDRFRKYVDDKANNFLKYANCRVTKDEIRFEFSWDELDKLAITGKYKDTDSEDLRKEKIEKVKVKIEKLFALANKNPSENEALSANNKAQELLAKYHLTLAEVYGNEKIEDDIEQVICDCGVGNPKCNWRHYLAIAIADGYCCKTFGFGRSKAEKTVVFYGYKDDIVLARRMFYYLFESCHKLGLKYARNNSDVHNGYMGFCLGFVQGAKEAMLKQCTALALVIQPEVEASWNVFSEGFKKARTSSFSIDYDAYNEGIFEGKRSLNGHFIEGC